MLIDSTTSLWRNYKIFGRDAYGYLVPYLILRLVNLLLPFPENFQFFIIPILHFLTRLFQLFLHYNTHLTLSMIVVFVTRFPQLPHLHTPYLILFLHRAHLPNGYLACVTCLLIFVYMNNSLSINTVETFGNHGYETLGPSIAKKSIS